MVNSLFIFQLQVELTNSNQELKRTKFGPNRVEENLESDFLVITLYFWTIFRMFGDVLRSFGEIGSLLELPSI